MSKFTCEVVQDFDGTYYANMYVDNIYIEGLPEYVDYNTLKEAIKNKTGVQILKRKDMIFERLGRKKYALIDATQYRGEGTDCRVRVEELIKGWKPCWE